MPYPTGTVLPRSRFAREHIAKGIAEAVLRTLSRRGVEVTPEARERIVLCNDLDLARTWLGEAITATAYTDLTGLDGLPSAVQFLGLHIMEDRIVMGITESVLVILDRRGVEVTATAREHVSTCKDIELARTWLEQAISATTYTELTGLEALSE